MERTGWAEQMAKTDRVEDKGKTHKVYSNVDNLKT